jgi:hypothetical protein
MIIVLLIGAIGGYLVRPYIEDKVNAIINVIKK